MRCDGPLFAAARNTPLPSLTLQLLERLEQDARDWSDTDDAVTQAAERAGIKVDRSPEYRDGVCELAEKMADEIVRLRSLTVGDLICPT